MSAGRTGGRRQPPPPVVDPNPPSRPSRVPPADPTTPAPQPAPAVPPQHNNTGVTNVGTNVGNLVPTGGEAAAGPPPPLSIDALMHGRVSPDDDRSQSGVRLPRYLIDAVRLVAATSRGRLSMQDIVTHAVKAYLPADVVERAWRQHGGDPTPDPMGEQ